jgi:hypothetical protein
MIEKTGAMKQGLPVPRPTRTAPRPARGPLALAWLLLASGLWLQWPGSAQAQGHARVIVTDPGELPTGDLRAAFAQLLAELRAGFPDVDFQADPARSSAEAFAACELARCRASWMLRRHAVVVLAVSFAAPPAPPRGAGAPSAASAPSVSLIVYGAGGQRASSATVALVVGDSGSFRESLRAGVAALWLPQPSVAPLLVACDVPGARVHMDGRPLGVVPLALTQVSPGVHRLHVSAPGHQPYEGEWTVPAAGLRVDIRLTPVEAP